MPPAAVSTPPALAAPATAEWPDTAGLLAFYHQAPCAYHTLDAKGRFLRINQTGLDWLGYRPDELIGKACLDDLLTPASQARLREQQPGWLANGQLRGLELELQRKDGSLLPVALDSQARRNRQGRLLGSEAAWHDLSALWLAREEEKRLLARDLHDELGNLLAALRLGLSQLQAKPPSKPARLQAHTTDMLALLEQTQQATRRLLTRLDPQILEQQGLCAALRWQLQEFAQLTGLRCKLKTSGGEPALGRNAQLALFRIQQEALNNIARHAQAQEVKVQLAVTASQVSLRVDDDGVGLSPARTAGRGIAGMQSRIRSLGGEFRLGSGHGGGCRLEVSLPCRAGSGA